MKPVFVRELKELSPGFVLALAFAVLAGANFTGPLSRQLDDMLAVACIGAFALGCLQGGLDRRRGGDLFALHRPIPAVRMEAARTLAGAAAILLAIVALAFTHRLATLLEIAEYASLRETKGVTFSERMADEHLGGGEVTFLATVLLATWAACRFAVGAVRARWAVPALVVLPFAAWSLLSHAPTLGSATASALLLAVLFSSGSGLCLAGDRR